MDVRHRLWMARLHKDYLDLGIPEQHQQRRVTR